MQRERLWGKSRLLTPLTKIWNFESGSCKSVVVLKPLFINSYMSSIASHSRNTHTIWIQAMHFIKCTQWKTRSIDVSFLLECFGLAFAIPVLLVPCDAISTTRFIWWSKTSRKDGHNDNSWQERQRRRPDSWFACHFPLGYLYGFFRTTRLSRHTTRADLCEGTN
jgi:hypothetical protein